MAVSEALGERKELTLSNGARIAYRETGSGEPVVFVHGLLVNGDLWRAVAPTIAAAGYRCISPDLPIGSHAMPMPDDADLSTPALARMLGEFIEAVGASGGSVVANDTGGALTQVLIGQQPDLIGRLVLTSCDAFDIFPPSIFKVFRLVAGFVPGAPFALTRLTQIKALQRSPAAFGWVTKRTLPDEIVESYTGPARTNKAIRRDVVKILRGIHPRYTEQAAARLPQFAGKPAIVVWAGDDKLFPLDYGQRLADLLKAEFVVVEDSYTFIAEDQPERLAEIVTTFLAGTTAPSR